MSRRYPSVSSKHQQGCSTPSTRVGSCVCHCRGRAWARSSLPWNGSFGSSNSSSLSCARCSSDALLGAKNPVRYHRDGGLRQALSLQRRVVSPGTDEVEPQRIGQITARCGAVRHKRSRGLVHNTALLKGILRPASRSSRARLAFKASSRARTSSRIESGQRYRQGFFFLLDSSSSDS